MRNLVRVLFLPGAVLFVAAVLLAQAATGSLDFSVHVTPSGARPEPVRQFTFYILTKSYAEIVKEIEAQDVLPTRDEFIDKWSCSPELKKWMKAHDTIDLAAPEFDQLVTPDDVMKVPEFFAAYQRANSGGITKGLPQPKYKEAEKDSNPARYQKQKEEYLAQMRKFVEANPITIQGIELELNAVNPKPAWDKLHNDHRRKIAQLAPDTAQLKYLAGKTETDLDGHAVVTGLPAGTYWISSLGLDAASGDRHLIWDVPAKIVAGQTTRLELSNLNATQPKPYAAP